MFTRNWTFPLHRVIWVVFNFCSIHIFTQKFHWGRIQTYITYTWRKRGSIIWVFRIYPGNIPFLTHTPLTSVCFHILHLTDIEIFSVRYLNYNFRKNRFSIPNIKITLTSWEFDNMNFWSIRFFFKFSFVLYSSFSTIV